MKDQIQSMIEFDLRGILWYLQLVNSDKRGQERLSRERPAQPHMPDSIKELMEDQEPEEDSKPRSLTQEELDFYRPKIASAEDAIEITADEIFDNMVE